VVATTPLSLQGTYQLVTLGADTDIRSAEYAAALERAVASAMQHLGVSPTRMLVRLGSRSEAELDRRWPSVTVFFGTAPGSALSPRNTALLDVLLADGTLVIPVVEDIGRFTALVPAAISHLNGISRYDCGANFERLAARVLEGFGLLRERRRLFISYRRIETSGVAAQLYEALDVAGFDVFLDTHGVLRPGEPFQEILWHRLADTDVILLLDTPGFLASRWTEEELARANTANLQILQLLWPGQEEASAAAFSTFHPLSVSDFEDGATLGLAARLREDSTQEIVDAVEGLRARAFAARHAFLVREFLIEAKGFGLIAYMTLDRSIVLRKHGGGDEGKVFVLPAVGVPDAERYEILEQLMRREAEAGRGYAGPPCLLYDESGIRSRWLEHLRWLNGNITSVRSVGLREAKQWLRIVAEGENS